MRRTSRVTIVLAAVVAAGLIGAGSASAGVSGSASASTNWGASCNMSFYGYTSGTTAFGTARVIPYGSNSSCTVDQYGYRASVQSINAWLDIGSGFGLLNDSFSGSNYCVDALSCSNPEQGTAYNVPNDYTAGGSFDLYHTRGDSWSSYPTSGVITCSTYTIWPDARHLYCSGEATWHQ